MSTKRDAINAAMGVAEDIAAGKVDSAALERQLVDEVRELFGTVVGEGDALFALQTDVARQVLERGGIGLAELLEWVAVLKRRSGPSDADSPVSVAHSPGNAASELETETEPDEGEPDEA